MEVFEVEEGRVTAAVAAKLQADIRGIRDAVARCCRCPGGGKGIPGYGEPGADVFLLAGRPGPGATPHNPWGEWRDTVLGRMSGELGWEPRSVYLSTALRCPFPRVNRRDLRRCSGFLADEFFIVRPRLMIVSGKVATVALRMALGDEIPANPKAGDVCTSYSTRFLFELDIARVDEDKKAAAVFWNVLSSVEDLFPAVKAD